MTQQNPLGILVLLAALIGGTLGGCSFGGGDNDGIVGDVSDSFQDLGDDLFGD